VLTDRDIRATNTVDEPNRVRPRDADAARIDEATLCASLPPVSWNVLPLARAR
jgi:alpha-N-arabinofuranosidase